ncbi:MAG: aldehyde dehydrogenase family protein, partial [Hyphomonas sp.]|nr:aldehyde dehydrogenase family protein [Hyphomonas sp.]
MTTSLADMTRALLQDLGVPATDLDGGDLAVHTPLTGEVIARVRTSGSGDIERALHQASDAFRIWRSVPAPRRGELVRLFGEELRTSKTELARLVTLEAGKIPSEGEGEVQEMIDI